MAIMSSSFSFIRMYLQLLQESDHPRLTEMTVTMGISVSFKESVFGGGWNMRIIRRQAGGCE